MPLNLQPNDGEFTPYIKYNAKAGRWYIKVDGQDGDVEVTNPVLAFDFARIKTGWLFFMEGMGPEKIWDPSPDTIAPRPPGTKSFKRGFEVMVHGAGNVGLREFASTAGAMVSPLLAMYAQYEKGAAANPGKVPVFACTGVKAISGKHGTNYSPVFTFKGWKPRAIFDSAEPRQTVNHESWSLTEAIAACEAAGITKELLSRTVKAAGHAKWIPEPCTALIRSLIAIKQKAAPHHEELLPDELPMADSVMPEDEIPF